MNIPTKSRSDLYTFFKRNKIPTESNFADLIDASLNQRDDGIAKPEQGPLSIEATGPADGTRPVLSLYASFADDAPAWSVALNARTDPATADTARSGFGLTDGAGALKLFVADGSGDVWVGGSVTATALHGSVHGPIDVTTPEVPHPQGRDGVLYRHAGQVYLTVDDHFFIRDSSGGDGWKFHFDTNAGALDIPTGKVDFGRQVRQMIDLWDVSYGIGVQGATAYFRSGGNFAWFKGGSHDNATFDPGPGGQVLLKLAADGTLSPSGVAIEQGDLSFGAQTRQMINLWRTGYGIGVQSGTTYFRSDNAFAWYRGGAHADNQFDAGGGDLMMKLEPSGRLTIDSGANTGLSLNDNLFVDGNGGTVRVTNNAYIQNNRWAIADPNAKAFTLELRESGTLELYGTLTNGQTDWRKLATFDAPQNMISLYPGISVQGERGANNHINHDGAFYRMSGQVYITVDDNLYVRDTSGAIPFHFDTNNGTLTGRFANPSDVTLKRNVRELEGSLALISGLRGVRYSMRADGDDGAERLGFVAQDVEPFFPELVDEGADGHKTLEYDGLIAPIVEAIKEQQAQITALEARLAEGTG